MKKTLIALAVLGSIAGVAQAQSAVTIYGKIDQGVRNLSNSNTKSTLGTGVNGVDRNADYETQLAQRAVSRVGFKGAEDLGNGLSAIFQLEARFNVDDGTKFSDKAFHAQSNVGLKGNFGTVRLGRIYNPVDGIAIAMDPFGQDGIGAMQTNALTKTRQDNSIRFDSANYSGFGVQAIYSLKEIDSVTTTAVPPVTYDANDGFGVAATYNNGPITAAAGWNRVTNSNDSDYWSLGGGYAFGPAKVTALYEDADIKTGATAVSQKNALIGLAYNIGAGTINASYGQLKTEVAANSTTDKKLALGYTHNLSKRTSLYGNVARTDWGTANVDTTNGVEVGVTHNF